MRLAFRFLVLTAARSGMVRGAVWDEFDMEEREWRVPAHRMKTHEEHRVLSAPGRWPCLSVRIRFGAIQTWCSLHLESRPAAI